MRTSLVLALSTVLLAASDSLACQCGGWPTPDEARTRAVMVFEGVVQEKWPVLASVDRVWFVVERWSFDVERTWKGAGRTADITEGYSNCSLIYAQGERALVYAYRHDSIATGLEAHKCGTPRGTATEQVRLLGPPVSAYPAVAPRAESPTRRHVRHAWVYFLMGLAAAHNVFTTDDLMPGLAGGYILVVLAALALLLQIVVAVAPRWRRWSLRAVMVVLLFLVGSWIGVGRAYVTNGYFAHLVEYECPTWPGG